MHDIVVVLMRLVLHILLVEHILNARPYILSLGMEGAGGVVLTGASMLLVLTVFGNDEVVGHEERLRLIVEEEVFVVGHTRQSGEVVTFGIERMARQTGKILVTHGKGTSPRRVVDGFAILALIPIDDAQAAPADGAIHQQHVWIL